MKPLRYLPAAALAASLALLPAHVRADNEEAELKEQPAAVQKTAHEQVGKSEITEVEPSYEEGQHATEVEYTDNGKKMAVVIAKDGTLIQKEYRMSPSDTPPAIQKSVDTLYPNAKISHIKQVEQKSTKFYELSVKTAGKSHQLKLDASGKTLK